MIFEYQISLLSFKQIPLGCGVLFILYIAGFNLLRIFVSKFTRNLGLQWVPPPYFFVLSLSGLGTIKWAEECSLLFYVLEIV